MTTSPTFCKMSLSQGSPLYPRAAETPAPSMPPPIIRLFALPSELLAAEHRTSVLSRAVALTTHSPLICWLSH